MSNDCNDDCKCCKYFLLITMVSFYITCIVFNILSLLKMPFEKKYLDFLKDNWNKSPISSISINDNFLYKLNRNINKNDTNDILNMFILKRMNNTFNYEYLLKEDIGDKNFHPCGTDVKSNPLFLPKDVECPINDIKITFNESIIQQIFNYKTIKIYDNLYLHYSNENIEGEIVCDLNISLVGYNASNYSRYINTYINSDELNLLEKGEFLDFIQIGYIGDFLDYDLQKDKRDLTYFKIALKYKFYILIINIPSFILLIIIIALYILLYNYKSLFITILILLFLLVQIALQEIIYVKYANINYLKSIYYYYDYSNELNQNYKDYDRNNFLLLLFLYLLTFTFIFYISCFSPEISMYFCFLSFLYCFLFFLPAFLNELKKERDRELENEVKNLEIILEKYRNEMNYMIKENKIILSKLEKNKEILKELKKNEIEEIDNDFISEYQKLVRDNEEYISTYKDLQKKIDNVEKQINIYKMNQYKQENL